MIKAKVHKSLNFLLQVLIIVFAYGFIYKHVILKLDIDDLLRTIVSKPPEGHFLILILAAFILMPLNLGIEAQKWRFLIGKFEYVSFLKALKAVFSGVTVSVFTPNRVGEYFGRVFILRHLHPFKGVLITFVGSMGQLMATIIAGAFGILFFLPKLVNIFVFPNHLIYLGVVLATLLVLTLLFILFLNFSLLPSFIRKMIPGRLGKIDKYTSVFEHYRSSELFHVLLLSMLRYLVFTVQFILLLFAFGVKMPLFHYFVVIPVIFFVMTVIPTIALSELGIRGSVALYLIGLYLNETTGIYDLSALGIIAASTLLWLFNLAIPAITGALFVFNLRFIRTKNNQSGQ